MDEAGAHYSMIIHLMHPDQRGGQESLADVRTRLLPEKRRALERLIALDAESRAQGGDIVDTKRREIGNLRRQLASEVGGLWALDRLLQEAYGEHLAEGERNRKAREAYRASRDEAA